MHDVVTIWVFLSTLHNIVDGTLRVVQCRLHLAVYLLKPFGLGLNLVHHQFQCLQALHLTYCSLRVTLFCAKVIQHSEFLRTLLHWESTEKLTRRIDAWAKT